MIGSFIYLSGACFYGYGASGELQAWAAAPTADTIRSPSSTVWDNSETTAFIQSSNDEDDD